MYNGIGLSTPRGSGTNGYVQRNLAFVGNRRERVDYKFEIDSKPPEMKKPSKALLEHERKRQAYLESLMREEGLSKNERKEKEEADKRARHAKRREWESMVNREEAHKKFREEGRGIEGEGAGGSGAAAEYRDRGHGNDRRERRRRSPSVSRSRSPSRSRSRSRTPPRDREREERARGRRYRSRSRSRERYRKRARSPPRRRDRSYSRSPSPRSRSRSRSRSRDRHQRHRR